MTGQVTILQFLIAQGSRRFVEILPFLSRLSYSSRLFFFFFFFPALILGKSSLGSARRRKEDKGRERYYIPYGKRLVRGVVIFLLKQ